MQYKSKKIFSELSNFFNNNDNGDTYSLFVDSENCGYHFLS